MTATVHVDDGPWCERTDLPQAWCGHCRASRVEVEYWFTARFAGRCGRCGRGFQPGDRIGFTLTEDYVCEGCGDG